MPDLRQQIKQQRNNLDTESQQLAAMLIADRISRLAAINRAKRIAVYNAVNGEIDCTPFTNKPILRKKRIFVPVIQKNYLKFSAVETHTKWTKNRYGILEPVYSVGSAVTGSALDIVIVPLVAFDQQCNRVGMGGGFYDRSFAFRKRRKKWNKPLLIGVAYSFQRVEQLQAQPWDVPLDCVVTEKECFGSC